MSAVQTAAQPQRSKKWNPVALALREARVAEVNQYRTLDVQSWKKAQQENLMPLPLEIFRSRGGWAALQIIHCWAAVTEERRVTKDNSAVPRLDGSNKSMGGFSLPDPILAYHDCERFIGAEPAWVRKLLEFIFCDGWEMECREIAYLMARKDSPELKCWEAVIAEEKSADKPERAVIALAERMMSLLRQAQVIVLDPAAEPPVSAITSRPNIRVRWTFDLREWTYMAELFEMEPGKRAAVAEALLEEVVRHMTYALGLGNWRRTPRIGKLPEPVTGRDLGDEDD